MDFIALKEAFKQINHTRLIVFGSYARGEARADSYVDVLVVVADPMPFPEKGRIASVLRRNLAEKRIDADIVIHSEKEVDRYKDLPGSIIRNALREGIAL